MRRLMLIFILLLSVVSLSLACGSSKTTGEKVVYSHDEAMEWAEKTLNTLSVEEKVAQMVWEQMDGHYIPEDTEKYQYLKRLVEKYGIGGFVLYGGEPHDTAYLLNKLQKASKIPLMVSADFENGCGQQITGAVWFPGNMALGALQDEKLAYKVGKAGAREGRAIGIHWTYSPVVDVQNNPQNPVLSVRSFGEDVEWLSRLSAAQIRGFQENGMLATAKHYPGRGDVELIPGTEFTINRDPLEELTKVELFAFQKAVYAGVGAIMTEHIIIPAMQEGGELPASMSEETIGWIRDKTGFQGIITSDDLWYEKITKNYGAEESCIRAVKTGHDTILKPADAEKTIIALAEAVKNGDISEERIDDSVRRILYWKAKLGLHKQRLVDLDKIDRVVGCREHRELNLQIAQASLTLLNNEGVLPITTDVKELVHISIMREGLERLFPTNEPETLDWQKVATATAAMKRFCVVSGGPGTGKTTTVAKILALLLELFHQAHGLFRLARVARREQAGLSFLSSKLLSTQVWPPAPSAFPIAPTAATWRSFLYPNMSVIQLRPLSVHYGQTEVRLQPPAKILQK
ncbi:hypothetical protein CEE39_09545 [bacterium (candidate division B38) B3_B38]|nr:MAG: hypothetical protein CEE39_09545 [bacterium (candidate division B38) B3_B38]